MVKIMENPIKHGMIWGFSHYFWVDTHISMLVILIMLPNLSIEVKLNSRSNLSGHIDANEPRKKPALLSMKYWLFNRDPYNGLLKSLYNWIV